jgi:hypothetical protein
MELVSVSGESDDCKMQEIEYVKFKFFFLNQLKLKKKSVCCVLYEMKSPPYCLNQGYLVKLIHRNVHTQFAKYGRILLLLNLQVLSRDCPSCAYKHLL